MPVRVRFAPSPTGYLHIGGLRTALFCYLFARSRDGTFILRIEDTDRSRFVSDAEEDITTCLEWAGIQPDEGPHLGPGFRQSERTAHYHREVQRLLDAGQAYFAFDTPEVLQAMRKEGAAYAAATRKNMDNAFTLPEGEVTRRIADGVPHVIRLRVPDTGAVTFTDQIKGQVEVNVQNIDDQVLLKSDGQPTYHLANVVDDHLMGITHVIRGEEWVPSTPKHILLYQALGWDPPRMVHLPLILSPTGGKLSKRAATRQGLPINVRDYIVEGYEPEAVVNFLALLGWHPSTEQEVFTMRELVDAFTLDRVSPSPAQFDLQKLQWLNAQHLRRLGEAAVAGRVTAQVAAAFGVVDPDYLGQVIRVVGDRMVMRKDLVTRFAYFFEDPSEYDARGVKKRWKADSPTLVEAYADQLAQLDSFEAETLETELRSLASSHEVGAGRIIHPVRLAVSGTTAGPSLFAMLSVLGQERCVRRLRRAAKALAQ